MRQILWRHRCAELYRAFINDPAKSGLVGEQSHHVRHERLEERIVLSAPTIDQPVDVDNVEMGSVINVPLSGITDGDGGLDGIKEVTAEVIGPMDGVVQNISVNYDLVNDPETGSLAIQLNNNIRGTDTILVTVTDENDEMMTREFTVTVPLAIDDSVSTTENAAVNGNLLTNDNILETEFAITNISIDGGVDQNPTEPIDSPGTLTLNAETGAFTFDPGTDFDYLQDGEPAVITVTYELTEWDDSRRRAQDVQDVESGTLTITITGENDSPSLDLDLNDSSGSSGNDYFGSYAVGQVIPTPAVDMDLDITDPDQNQEFATATIILSNPADGADEVIAVDPSVVPMGVIIVDDSSVSHQITIMSATADGTITEAQLEALLKTLTYKNTALMPTLGDRVITVAINDGISDSEPATSTIQVALQSDLAISASGTPSQIKAGEEITYVITATNTGLDDAAQVVVNDLIPVGTSFISYEAEQGIFDQNTEVWSIGDLASGEMTTITLVLLVNSSTADGATLTNLASIASNDVGFTDLDALNDTLNEQTTVTRQAELDLQVDGTTLVEPGGQASYTITLTNSGPSDASNILLNVSVPAGATLDMSSESAGTYDSMLGTWTIPMLAANASVTLTLDLTVDSDLILGVGTELVVSSSITSFDEEDAETDDSDNMDTAETDVKYLVDLEVTASVTPDPVTAGEQLTYTITATNNGPSDATGVSVTGLLPEGTLYFSDVPEIGSFNDATGEWIIGDLASGTMVALTLIVDVESSVADGATIDHAATIVTSDPESVDPESNNNLAMGSTDVQRQAELSIVITGPEFAEPGETDVAYTITLTNVGPSDASNIVVSIPIPSNTSYSSDTPTLGNYDDATGEWSITSLVVGGSATLTLLLDVDSGVVLGAGPEITITANIDSFGESSTETDKTNNSDSVYTDVKYQVDVSVELADSEMADPIVAGTPLTYFVTVTNQGQDDATNLTIDVPIPTGTTYFSDNAGLLGDSFDSGSGIWTIGTLTRDETVTLELVVVVNPDVVIDTNDPELSLIASIAGYDQFADDAVSGNNSDTEETEVDREVDIDLVSIVGPATANAGETVEYTIVVRNNGPSQATDVRIQVNPPAGTIVSTDAGSPGYNDANNYFLISSLNPGEVYEVTLTYSVQINPAFTGESIMVTAFLREGDLDQPDTDSTNNSKSTVTRITTEVDLEITIDAPMMVVAGQDIDYTLTVDNLGPSDTAGVVVAIPVPTNGTIDPDITLNPAVTQEMIFNPETMIDEWTGAYLWTIGNLGADATPPTLTFTIHTDAANPNEYDVAVSASIQDEDSSDDPNPTNNSDSFVTTVKNDSPTSTDETFSANEDDNPRTFVIELQDFVHDDQQTAGVAPLSLSSVIVNGVPLNPGETVMVNAGNLGTAIVSLNGTELTFMFPDGVDGLREGEVFSQIITYRATDPALQSIIATLTVQITGQNDAPEIQPLTAVNTNEANVITLTGTFTDLDRALGTGEDIHVLSVTAPIDHPFEVVPGSTIIVFNAVTGKYNFSVDVIFHDDNPTGSPSDLVTLEFEIDDQIVTATGEREVTVNNLPPSIIDYEADVQLSTLGELVIPITLSDPSALDTLTLSVNRVAENDDVFEAAVANSSDPADLVVWNPSAMDPRKGELIVRYDANDFDGLSFTLRIIATDDDTGESSIIRVNATVPAGLGFLPVTPEPEDPTAPAPLPFSLPPIPESTNTISLPDNVQRALAPPAKGETVALELRIVWNYGEPDEWQEKIRELIAKDRKELQEKLQELSELLQGLPDNQYRAFLVRGDGTENQLMEVRIREGKIVDLNQQEESSYTPGASEVSTEPTAPEQIPGEPMSRLERAFPSRISERPHDMKQTAADPFARFGRGSQIEAWQSVYRARVATAIDN